MRAWKWFGTLSILLGGMIVSMSYHPPVLAANMSSFEVGDGFTNLIEESRHHRLPLNAKYVLVIDNARQIEPLVPTPHRRSQIVPFQRSLAKSLCEKLSLGRNSAANAKRLRWVGIDQWPTIWGQGVGLNKDTSYVSDVIGRALTGISYMKTGSSFLALLQIRRLLGFNGEIGANLGVADFSIGTDGSFGLAQRSQQQHQTAYAYKKATGADNEHPQSPIGHILLGLQVLIGVAAIFVSSHFGRKAFSDDIYRGAGDRAFTCYIAGSLVLLGVGALLLLTVCLTLRIVA